MYLVEAARRVAWRLSLIAVIGLCGLWLRVDGAEAIKELNLRAIGRGPTSIPVNRSHATVVVFISVDCPMSMDYSERVGQLEKKYSSRGVQVILVDSNRNESDRDVENVRNALKIATPIYRDTGAILAERLTATATPTAVVLDATGAIRYKGNLDDSRDPTKVKTRFVEEALAAVLSGRPVLIPHTRVLGCSIKR